MAKDSPSQLLPRIGVRMEEDLRQRLMEAAYKANRSLNAEIIARLEATFEVGGQESDLEKRMDRLEAMIQGFMDQGAFDSD